MSASTDAVTSAAVAAGDVDAIRARERVLAALCNRDRALARGDRAVQQALEEVVDTPTIGAIAAIALARAASGWTVEIGARNGLATFQAFVTALVSSGWFSERHPLTAMTVPDFSAADPAASLAAIVGAVHPGLTRADERRVCQALIASLAHGLGPDGVAPEFVAAAVPGEGLLGKTAVLERRVTTVASSVLAAGDGPVLSLAWSTETFERTKEGKDNPKAHTTRRTKGHHLTFNLERWRDGDRSLLLDYYQSVDEWLNDFNSRTGRMRHMPCFKALMKG